MAPCSTIKADGTRCKGQAIGNSERCFSHHSDMKEERRRRGVRGGKRAGRGRPQTELEAIKAQLYRIARDIEAGKLEKGVGAVLVQVFNAIRRAIEDQRKIRELDEVLERIEALESQQQKKNGGVPADGDKGSPQAPRITLKTRPEKEATRKKIIRALNWLEELRQNGRPRGAPLSDIVPKNEEERENLVILKGFDQWTRELWPERYH
jgi:hypothetical protein